MAVNPPSYQDESSRISALMRYRDLDYSDSEEFKTITELAADICNMPVALVSFVDTDDVKLRFMCGLKGVSSVPRDISFCHHTVMGTEPLVVEDATLDPRFKDSPVVTNDPKFRFYTGIPIVTSDGYSIGALCVLDYKPNNLTAFQIKSLSRLSKIVCKSLESKLLESKKREQDSHSRLFFNNAPVCIHGIDLKGCFTSMNPSGLNMLDLENEEQIKGISYLSGVAAEDCDRIKQLLENAIRGEKSIFEFTGTSGKIYSSCFVPIKNEQDEVTKLMGISEDITVRRHAEEKLEKEMERLELVMRATNDSVWDLDKITNKVWWNETYTKTFGRPPEENTWEWWLDRIHPNDRERVRDSLAAVPDSDSERWYEEYRMQLPDGSYAYVLDRAYIARDKTGKTTRILGAMRDITKQVEADIRHKELQSELNHVARLSNMNEMATGLAHEINQPLTAITHYCDAAQSLLASESISNNTLNEILQSASEQAHRAGEIIRHCRQFVSKQPMQKLVVNLNDLTQETVRYLSSDLQDQNISIQVSIDEKLPAVQIDKVQIQQVLVNLIRNGLEAMHNNHGKVRKLTVYTHLNGKNANEPEAQVTVADTGPGLKPSNIDNLFQPFYTTKTNGMGMGLSISRSIIDAHGGKLWLDSQNNNETQFHFTLPIEA